MEISGSVEIYGFANVSGNAKISGHSKIYENARVYESPNICDYAEIFGNAKVHGRSSMRDYAKAYGNANILGGAAIFENARVYENATLIDRDIFKNMNVRSDMIIRTVLDYTSIWGFEGSTDTVLASRNYKTGRIIVSCRDFVGEFDDFKEQAKKYADDDKHKQEYVEAVVKSISQYFNMFDEIKRRKENANDDICS